MNGPKIALLAGVLAVGGLANPAAALVTFQETPSTVAPPNGLMTTQAGVTTQDFNGVGVGSQPPGFSPASGTAPGGGVVAAGGVGNLYATPNGDTSQFYAVAYNPSTGPLVPASDTFSAGANFNYFGLYWGSIDTYNTISFFNGASLVASFGGASFMPATGNQTAANTNQFIDFFFTEGDTYNSVVFATNTLNFELDNIAYGNVGTPVPEPASMALLGTGLLGIGMLRRRKAQTAI